MPRMSDTMTEGVLVSWQVKVGESISPGDLIAEVETDKATMELESYQEGVLLHIGVQEGDAVPVNSLIAIVGEKGEDISELLKAESSEKPATPQAKPAEPKVVVEKKVIIEEVAQTPPADESVAPKRIKASPLAKRLAFENNIDLTRLSGSGEDGRIVKRDIEAVLEKPETATPTAKPTVTQPTIQTEEKSTEEFEDVKNSQMRKVIARRLGESKFQAPHFYLTMTINMDKIWKFRKQLNEKSPVKISFNDLIIKAASLALRKHPAVNASWNDEFIRYNKHINIGMAVAVNEGLLVPVIRHADNKSLSHIATETKAYASKARDKKLQPDEMSGNTFSISNLGMMDIDQFTAIVNPPDSCIMAVGRITDVAAVREGKIVPTKEMKITLSCDHRVVDGAVGAAFLQTFKGLIEEPISFLI
ncbi:UNVERIFIED_CONTAM: hypothetical protein GTU68_059985 [Idotea baltica]|nr:hypothetical protein [Idotea baltica]